MPDSSAPIADRNCVYSRLCVTRMAAVSLSERAVHRIDQRREQAGADGQGLRRCLVGLLPLQEARRLFIQVDAAGRLHTGECLRIYRGLRGLRGVDLLRLTAQT